MRAGAIALLGVAGLSLGCATYERGRFAAVSTTAVRVPMTIVLRDAVGRSCDQVGQQRYSDALRDAIASAPGANALMNATYSFERLCIVVRGAAVRIHSQND